MEDVDEAAVKTPVPLLSLVRLCQTSEPGRLEQRDELHRFGREFSQIPVALLAV